MRIHKVISVSVAIFLLPLCFLREYFWISLVYLLTWFSWGMCIEYASEMKYLFEDCHHNRSPWAKFYVLLQCDLHLREQWPLARFTDHLCLFSGEDTSQRPSNIKIGSFELGSPHTEENPRYFTGYTLPPGNPCENFALPPPPADKKRTGPRRKSQHPKNSPKIPLLLLFLLTSSM